MLEFIVEARGVFDHRQVSWSLSNFVNFFQNTFWVKELKGRQLLDKLHEQNIPTNYTPACIHAQTLCF